MEDIGHKKVRRKVEARQRLWIGVIGVGKAGREHIAAYQKLQDAAVVAVVDPNLALGHEVAVGVGAHHFPEATEEFGAAIDAVSICPPHRLLADHAFKERISKLMDSETDERHGQPPRQR